MLKILKTRCCERWKIIVRHYSLSAIFGKIRRSAMLPMIVKTAQNTNTYTKSEMRKLLYRITFLHPSTIFAIGFSAKTLINPLYSLFGSLQNIGVSQKHMLSPIFTIFCISLNFAQINAKILPREYTKAEAAASHRGRYTAPYERTPSAAQTTITMEKKITLEINADSVRTAGRIFF